MELTHSSTRQRAPSPWPTLRWLAAGLFLAYFFTSSGGFEVSDTYLRYETARSWLEGRRGALPEHLGWDGGVVLADGRVITLFGPLQSILMMPILLAVRVLPTGGVDRAVVETFAISLGLFPLVSTLAMTVLFLALHRFGYRARDALLATLAVALGSIFWHYARMGQEENIVALAFSLWLLGAARLAAGSRYPATFMAIGGAMALATRWAVVPTLAVLALLSLVLLVRYRRHVAVSDLALGVLIAGTVLGLLLFYNYWRFGDALETGYGLWNAHYNQKMFLTQDWADHLAALVASPYRGLLFFSPIAFVGIAAVFLARPGTPARTIGLGGLAVLAVSLLFLAFFRYWAGGHSWGPRFLTALHVFFAPALAGLFARRPPTRIALLVPLFSLLQIFSTMLPASTEEYARYNIEQRRPGWCTPWRFECTAVSQRIPRALAAVANTISNEPGVTLSGRPMVAPEVVLGTSDYRTLYWWPFRIAFRLGVLPLPVALGLCLAGLGAAAFCLARAWRSSRGDVCSASP